jgi:hypothetical protein
VTPPVRRRRAGLIVFGGIALAIAVGVLVERQGLFTNLAFAIQRTPARMPSTLVVPEQDVRLGIPILSLFVRDRDLHDPETGLLTHTLERGPAWERPAFVSYFDGGQLRFAAQAGVRIHGGKSRENSPVQSLRLYFERAYGATAFQSGVLFEGRADPLRQIVVHNDLRQDLRGVWWHFVNPLAFDIAREVGAIAPETQPARVMLNGQTLGAYVLTEHVTSRGFQESHFGHRSFTIADNDTIEDLWRWQREQPVLTRADVERMFDVENLTNWFISVLFCATTDAFQGVLLRDDSETGGQWFWVNWDMDHSFMDLYQQADVGWRHDTFSTLLGRRELRSGLVTRLLQEDPRYAVQFKQALADALNHRLTSTFLMNRFEHYGRLLQALQVPDREYLTPLAEFLRNRASAIRDLAPGYLPEGRSHRATFAAPAGATFEIDGYPAAAGYEGWYFTGTSIRLTVTDPWRDRFSHWAVNGRSIGSGVSTLVIRVSEDLRIDAVFR